MTEPGMSKFGLTPVRRQDFQLSRSIAHVKLFPQIGGELTRARTIPVV